MNRPQPKHMLTDRQRLATQFAFTHFALTLHFGHDAWADFRVQKDRRKYLAAVARDERANAAYVRVSEVYRSLA